MFGDRFSSSTSCSKWRRETKPERLDQSRSCYFLKVATHPSRELECAKRLLAAAGASRRFHLGNIRTRKVINFGVSNLPSEFLDL